MISKLTIILIVTLGTVYGQDKKERELIVEGNKLYRSEMASWYGTDIFLGRFASKTANSAGYFSYINGDKVNCIFFSKGETPMALATISFDSTYNVNTALVDSVERKLTELETDLYSIRRIALAEIR